MNLVWLMMKKYCFLYKLDHIHREVCCIQQYQEYRLFQPLAQQYYRHQGWGWGWGWGWGS
jgi:hypothetical protein